jgi:hypothetical protein
LFFYILTLFCIIVLSVFHSCLSFIVFIIIECWKNCIDCKLRNFKLLCLFLGTCGFRQSSGLLLNCWEHRCQPVCLNGFALKWSKKTEQHGINYLQLILNWMRLSNCNWYYYDITKKSKIEIK